ncbi:hypothetical protein J3R30DRAFT_3404792 [Lentinula aciculospora]|uniref:Uncharacterized protein n=1 Tax=Lentinula aciculospora TaxID=153920 RepID=A0A9W9DMG7_9AGAR|nr:hypothetical protein J3R30DRAFT_3404792 [Lentinula aciculospora]
MSYLTPAQILDQAAYETTGHRPPQYGASSNIGVVPAQLHNRLHHRIFQHESPVSAPYAGHSFHDDANISGDAQGSFRPIQRQKSTPMMNLGVAASYAPVSPSIPVSSFSHHTCYSTNSPVAMAPLSERRNSQDTGPFHQGTHRGATKRKGSSSGTSYAYPDYLNLPPGYRNASQEAQKQFEYPDYLNLPLQYRRRSTDVQEQAKYPDYLNLPPEYRTEGQRGITRSSAHTVYAQNPYPFTSPGHGSPQSLESLQQTRGHPQSNRYPADPFPIIMDGRGPSNYIRVPQRVFYDETEMNRCMSYSKPITFKLKNSAELGVRLSTCLNENHIKHPNIEDKDVRPFCDNEVYREIRLKILWPGYYEYPFTRRVNIRKGEMTKISILFNIATAISDFVKKIQNDRCICERGLETWKLTGRQRVSVDQLILTGIVHRGGPNWQPEIWCP